MRARSDAGGLASSLSSMTIPKVRPEEIEYGHVGLRSLSEGVNRTWRRRKREEVRLGGVEFEDEGTEVVVRL